ncbi:MBL fold metallo-hydrolase [Cellulomonas sp. JH27-2]|uniref:MBL fold metallo-hydrolase n=1 Tax=Cellulomonas sp. JH27-2 TaxID=2774139 RepID=UPI001CD904B9|nr:MBL fold metallo-hydrolase [Cellulomonas sp. JH27-2]
MSTTSTVVVHDERALLVDPAWQPDELAGLAAELAGRRWTVVAGFATHAHHDHLLWHPGFGGAPRFASPRTARLAADDRATLVAELGDFPEDLVDLVGRVSPVDTIPPEHLPGIDVELVVHDAHAPGHTALWLPRSRVLVVGDMLSDLELPLPFDPDDLPAYLAGLDTLAPYVARAAVLVPGHGTPTRDPMARLEADRRYLSAVAAGRTPSDPRLSTPDMQETHRRIVAMASPSSTSSTP